MLLKNNSIITACVCSRIIKKLKGSEQMNNYAAHAFNIRNFVYWMSVNMVLPSLPEPG